MPTRLVAGLFILKHMHNLSDEVLCARWLKSPYYQFILLADFRAAKHAADSVVKQGDGIVDQARDRVERRRDQGCAAAQGRQGPQMLSGEAGTLAGKLAQALRVAAFGAGHIETDCSENDALLYRTRKGAMTGSAFRQAAATASGHSFCGASRSSKTRLRSTPQA